MQRRSLNRIYTGDFSTLAAGRCRYAMLLGEDGFIRDDGIVARLAADRFHVTTTTGGAESVLHHMEDFLQTEFSDLRVWLTPVTEQWAVIAVQGPRSAEAAGAVHRRHRSGGDAAHERAGRLISATCRSGCSGSALPASWGSRSTCRRTTPRACGTPCSDVM